MTQLDIILDNIDYWTNEAANDDTLIDYMTLEEWLASADTEADDIELIEY